MIDFIVKDGMIASVEGDSISVLSMDASELSGLPYNLLDSEPLSAGLFTRYYKKRTGERIPIQISVFEDKNGFRVWEDSFR